MSVGQRHPRSATLAVKVKACLSLDVVSRAPTLMHRHWVRRPIDEPLLRREERREKTTMKHASQQQQQQLLQQQQAYHASMVSSVSRSLTRKDALLRIFFSRLSPSLLLSLWPSCVCVTTVSPERSMATTERIGGRDRSGQLATKVGKNKSQSHEVRSLSLVARPAPAPVSLSLLSHSFIMVPFSFSLSLLLFVSCLVSSASNGPKIQVRICYYQLRGLLDFDEVKKAFVGIMAPEVSRRVKELNVEPTIIHGTGMGKLLSNGSFDGCLGSLERNESDVIMGHVPLSAIAKARNVVAGPVTGFSTMTIISVYEERGGLVRSKNIVDSLNTFLPMTWAAICGFVLFLWLFLTGISLTVASPNKWTLQAVLKRLSKYAYRVTSLALRQSAYHRRGLKSLLSATLGLGSVMLFFRFLCDFFSNLIFTDTASVDPPMTIESYQDIITANKMPTWSGALAEADAFKFADADSEAGKLWSYGLKLAGGDESKLVIGSDPEDVVQLLEDIWSGKSVLLMGRGTLQTAAKNICAYHRRIAVKDAVQLGLHVARDPSDQEEITVMAFNRLTHSALRCVYKRLQKILEHGFQSKDSAFNKILFDKPAWEYERICLDNQVLSREIELKVPDVKYYCALLVTVSCLLTLALLMLKAEFAVKYWQTVCEATLQAISWIRSQAAAAVAGVCKRVRRIFKRRVAPAPAGDAEAAVVPQQIMD